MYESLTRVRFKRKYPKQLAQTIYDRYQEAKGVSYPLVYAFQLLKRDDLTLMKLHTYAYIHLNGCNWTKARRDIDHIKGFLRALDVISLEALQELNLTAHEQMMILEELPNE